MTTESLQPRVHRLLTTQAGVPANETRLVALAGDASNRRYYRVHFTQDDREGTYILMELLDDRPAQVFEEATNLETPPDELPFVNVHRFLSGLEVPVPIIHAYDQAGGLLLLEDLGDVMLEGVVKRGDGERIRALYRQAVELLARLQVEGTRRRDDNCVAFRQRFNVELLNWEFEHFLEFGVEEREGRKMDPAERAAVRAVFEAVSRELDAQPQFLNHRDYHSRNLMVRGADIAIIDFQDALLGPAAYDLASLLRDSYVTLGEDLIDDLIGHYLDTRQALGAGESDEETFRRVFDLQSVQRNLKAAGRFVFIDVKKGNDKFLRYVPNTLANVRRNMEKHELFHPALDVLSRYVPEFQS